VNSEDEISGATDERPFYAVCLIYQFIYRDNIEDSRILTYIHQT